MSVEAGAIATPSKKSMIDLRFLLEHSKIAKMRDQNEGLYW